ncbi:MAG: hypothetical protein HYU66_07930 [Armatimonadetes bacterium]|nr:hypothetical protein [Armatimonadota bacterium]
MAEQLQPLITKDTANMVSLDESNTLVITDAATNVKRLLEIIAVLDEAPVDQREIEVVPLENGNAEDVQTLLSNVYADPVGSIANQLQRGRNPMQQQAVMQMLQAGLIDPSGKVKVTADSRTNSLVVFGTREVIDELKKVIRQLDRDITAQVIFRRFKLQFADAQSVTEDLQNMFETPQGNAQRMPAFMSFFGRQQQQGRPGFAKLKENIVVADVRTNSLLITATPENMLVYEDIIRAYDQASETESTVEVIPLEFAQADTVANTLTRVLQGARGGGRGFFFFLFGGGSQSQDSPLQQLQNVTVVAENSANALVVSGPSGTLPAVRRIVEMLDQPQAQVYISVIIADVTLKDEQQLGVELSWNKAPLNRDKASTDFGTDAASTGIAQGIKYALVSSEFQALLKALSDKNKVKVLSTPHITTLDNVQATISIGTKFPVPKSQSLTQGGQLLTQYDFQDVDIKLDVKPRVSLGSQMVVLEVNQNIDEITDKLVSGGNELPIISTRVATTTVMVQSGQTVVIGGIIRDRTSERKTSVPILGDLPLVGPLFRRTDDTKERTELMVFLTPFVVTTDEQLQRIREQRQKDLVQNFPQVEDYLRQQLTYGEDIPPKPGPPEPEPQPKPKPEPVPQAMGPERPRIRVDIGPEPPTPTTKARLGPAAP